MFIQFTQAGISKILLVRKLFYTFQDFYIAFSKAKRVPVALLPELRFGV